MNLSKLNVFDPVSSWNFDLMVFEDGGEKASVEVLAVEAGKGKFKVTQVASEQTGFLDIAGKYVSIRVYSNKPETLFDVYYHIEKLIDVSVSANGEAQGDACLRLTLTYEAKLDGIQKHNKEA